MTTRIAIVEDDLTLRLALGRGLREDGFDVVLSTASGGDLLAGLGDSAPEVFVVDIGLPDTDGRDLVLALRARGVRAPVLLLTARGDVTDRLSGFRAGADDYLPKPFHFEELVLRLRALVRRGHQPADPPDGLFLDLAAHEVGCDGKSAGLTPTEFRLLAALLARPGEVVRRQALIAAAWPAGGIVHDNTLDSYLLRLRRKLAALGRADAIVTVRGVGYRVG
ncbi:response regulator transcription factor [Acrocarpospora macrocephala]|uniref:DNA-binding response regulator n=1 Tax=Acrocarpospora macrocephala TaxID=150177 RepID=A0A5M3WGQ7_9ACTN|nr:response regulator transcription factor [Acrocarpospora macrocephala]GES07312.1 DNA-binding response regulator [Acrocarpospora macrocephala]